MHLGEDIEKGISSLLEAFGRLSSAADTWAMIVRERHLVFAHWPVPIDALRPLVAETLELDLYAGQAWITVEMLETTLVRFRGLPAPPIPLNGYEMNVRTYVRCNGERGIHFLSMDCPGLLGSAFMRWLSKLPLHQADVIVGLNGDNYHAESIRISDDASVQFAFSGRLAGAPVAIGAGSVDEFLLNQTILFATDASGPVYRARVAHRPHVVQPIDGIVEMNTLVPALGLTLPAAPPLLHYCPGDDALAFGQTRVARPVGGP